MSQFHEDASGREADFPAFCFIEPDYNGIKENDDHPPHDVMKAQALLAEVYNALRANPEIWKTVLFVVFYDEHGGFYDHVEPLPAMPPSLPQPDWEFTFDRLGVRVPAILISPWVKKGFDSTPFDHTSLLKYLSDKWDLGPLGSRTLNANSIGKLLGHDASRSDTIPRIDLTPDQLKPPDHTLEADAAKYISGHHKALALIGRRLGLELLRESPLTYAWLTYGLEWLLHRLLGIGNPWVFRLARKRAKKHWTEFRDRKRRHAIPRLAAVIRDPMCSPPARRHAIETLGLVTNERFHQSPDPSKAAGEWLQMADK